MRIRIALVDDVRKRLERSGGLPAQLHHPRVRLIHGDGERYQEDDRTADAGEQRQRPAQTSLGGVRWEIDPRAVPQIASERRSRPSRDDQLDSTVFTRRT
jgi:hypothetical protein